MRLLILSSRRVNHESFSSYTHTETFLLKAADGDDYEAEFKFLEASYSKDVDTGPPPRHLRILEVMLK